MFTLPNDSTLVSKEGVYENRRSTNSRRSQCCLVLVALLTILIFFFNPGIAVAQTTTPTDGGIPSGLSQGAQEIGNFDHVNLYNGNLILDLPLVNISGRGSAKASLDLVRNSSHWVVQKYQDRRFITYTPKADLSGRAIRLPFYEPARLYKQTSTNQGALCLQGSSGYPATTLKRLVFITSDGEEHELRDQGYDGQPLYYNFFIGSNGAARGTIFRSTDGSDITFISDTTVYDECSNTRSETGTGYLLLGDGSRYRFVNGLLETIRDRNGNLLTFAYGTNFNDKRTYRRLVSVTDSLNRIISITYSDFGIVNPPVVLYDQITYNGFGGNPRNIKVWYSDLGQALRSGYTLQTYNCLFPNLNSSWICGGSSGNTVIYTATVASKVELPDGRRYQLYYNPYRELARVELPTGGVVEYDYSPQNPDYSTVKTITRRVSERRVFLNASDTSPVSKQIYSSTITVDTSVTPYVYTTTSTVEYRDPNNLLLSERHLFHGAGDSKTLLGYPPSYKAWDEGLEFQTDVLDSNGILMRSVNNTWQQRAQVTWWSTQANAPTQDPRIVETIVILADTNQQAKRTFVYSNDRHNNVIDLYEYDYGVGAPGALLRRRHMDYLTINPVNGINYADPANGQSYTLSDPHLRNLPTGESIYGASGTEMARTSYEYDNYTSDSNHAALVSRTSISWLDPAFTSSYQPRGNVTSISRYILATPVTAISAFSQYDIAGNVVRIIDPRGYATTFDFTDRFGTPDGDARLNPGPTNLGSQFAFAFSSKVTKVVNGLTFESYTQFDYNLGNPVDSEDINSTVSSTYFEDSLDRPTKVIAAANQAASVKVQTIFNYDDANKTITTSSDQNSFNDPDPIKTQVVYDGFGRTVEKRQYETATTYIMVKQIYDALGRKSQVSNPYRAGDTVLWTTTAYDSLNRVISVTTSDSAVAGTAYSGNTVTVTDQIGKQRKSVTDALGRLKEVYEDPGGSNYLTSYGYDVLDDLTTVTQGSQTRTFVYDSLKRLTSATNPESGTITYQYDNNGNLTQRTDARTPAVTTTYTYDELNRNAERYYSDGTPAVYLRYDSYVNGKGRLSYIYVPEANSSMDILNYDALGRPLGRRQWFYSNSVWQYFDVYYTYDLAGHVKTIKYPSVRTVTYNYDQAGRLGDKDALNLAFTGNLGDGVTRTYSKEITYSPFGGLQKEKFGTDPPLPLYNKLWYNSRGQLAEIRVGTTYNDPMDTGWQRGAIINHYSNQCWGMCGGSTSTTPMTDNNGNLKKQEHEVPDNDPISTWQAYLQTYSYDNLNRLQSVYEGRYVNGAPGPSSSVQQYYLPYDRWGNRTIDYNQTSPVLNRKQFTISSSNNRLGVPAGEIGTMTFDNAGNLITDTYTGAGYRTYDAENRMTTAWGNSQQQVYTYDGEGRRVRRKVDGVETWQIYGVDGEVLAEYAANAVPTSPQKEYGYRNGQLLITAEASANIKWLVADQLGTPRMIFDKTGSLANTKRHDYLPFGEELIATQNGRTTGQGYTGDSVRQKFTLKERDNETGLDFFEARYYASTQGRFTSVDPIMIAPNRIADPQQLDLYSYARNNPLLFVDPNGEELEAVIFLSAVTGRNEIGFLDERAASDFVAFVSSLQNDLRLTPRFNYLFRTTDEQQRLYDNRAANSNPVAVPGTSPHESGLAFDINRNGPGGLTAQGLDLEALRAQASNFGWYPLPSGNDPPHLQYPGIVPISGRNADYLALIRENQESYRRFVSLNSEFFGTQSIARGRTETDLQLMMRVSFLNQINRMDRADRQAGRPRQPGEQPRGMQVPPQEFIQKRRRGGPNRL